MTVRTKEYNEYKFKIRIELVNSMCTQMCDICIIKVLIINVYVLLYNLFSVNVRLISFFNTHLFFLSNFLIQITKIFRNDNICI